MDERGAVRAVQEDGAPAPRGTHDEHDRERRAQRRAKRVAREDDHAGHADRDRHADPFNRRLHRDPGPLGYGVVHDVDRRAGRAVGEGEVGDASGADGEQQRHRAGASGSEHDEHRHREPAEHERVGGDAQPQPEPAQQRAGEEEQERDARDVDGRRVAGEEPREVGGVGELRAGPVVDEVVAQLAAERREHLVGEDQDDEPAGEQPPHRWSVGVAGQRGIASPRRERGRAQPVRIAAPGRPHQPGESRLGHRGREQQLLGSAEPRDELPGQDAADHRPDREAGHDPREARLDPRDVEDAARLARRGTRTQAG